MSDSDIPDRIGPAIRWVLAGIALFVFFLLAVEKANEGHWTAAAINGCLFVVILIVAVKWHYIARFLGSRKVTMLYVGLLVLCCSGAGFALGKLMGRTQSDPPIDAASIADTGRITWNFEQTAKGLGFFIGFNRTGEQEARITNFGAQGKNISSDPITNFNGVVRSNITNEEWPIYIVAEDPNIQDPFSKHIPTKPDETFGIPPGAEFSITTFNKSVFESDKDGMPLSKFLRDFAEFTVILEYDGKVVRRVFTKDEVRAQVALFERQSSFDKNSEQPRVRRRPNAAPPIQPSFALPPPATPPDGKSGK